ncbi:MAG TPA: DEAD/DEAH box helicase [Candidatus Acidoferrales bacterium]|nr:DEAD/DEAH box helicase [Candidatus Acidoferrales bacterium]
MQIQELPIPDSIKAVLAKASYHSLYPPQEDAIRAGVLEGKNLVLASPTASGKTLVAELASLKSVLEKNGKVLYLTPLRALASEKYEDFQKYATIEKTPGHRVRVAVTSGDYDSSDIYLAKYDIIISTNEKADSLLRHRSPWISNITVVVADEIHLITEADRGPTLEVVLTRLLKINPRIQVIALSATIKNAKEIGEWLEATPITTEWRPVPLREGVYYNGQIQFKDGSARVIPKADSNPVFETALEVIRDGGQALIFAETRRQAVEMGKRAGALLRRSLPKQDRRGLENIAQRILSSGERTRLGEALAEQVLNGVAFHHAGLPSTHRKIVEDSFKTGRLKILSATPTLAAGVNLPARTVIISSYERYEAGYGRYPISVLEYKQFCGRAGRPRYDKFGEAVLIARTEDEQDYLLKNYALAEPERIWSKLGAEKVLRPHVLATIATRFATTEDGLDRFFARTFYAFQYDPKMIHGKLGEILSFLHREQMVEFEGEELRATKFGRRVSELYIDPVSAVVLRDGLYTRAKHVTDVSFLHLISRTPDISPKLYPRRGEDEMLDLFANEHEKEFMCEVPEYYGDTNGITYEEFLAEIKCARVLYEWINETSEDGILEVHRVEPGDILRMVDTAKWLLHATYRLAELFGHKDLLNQLYELQIRCTKGVKSELIPLVELDGVGRVRARSLFNAGFKTLEELKRASVTDLMNVPTIGPSVAKKIKEQVGGLIKAEEWEALKSKTAESTEQSLLTDYKEQSTL